MPNQTKAEFIKFISNFPDITFIWKYETPDDGCLPHLDNLILCAWIPQSALLGESILLHLVVSQTFFNSVMSPGIQTTYFFEECSFVTFADRQTEQEVFLRKSTALGAYYAYDKLIFKHMRKLWPF